MITGIDHTVVVAESLAEAAVTAGRLGFRTTPPAQHPFGTANTLVQLRGAYLEHLAIVDESLFPEERPDRYSFPSFNRDFLIGEGAGIAKLALKTDDPEALTAHLAAQGLSRYPTFSFERTAQAPDGSELPVSFTLAFASHPDLVRAGIFALRHNHAPDNFWHAAYQTHPNTAETLLRVTMVSPNPERTEAMLAAITGVAPTREDWGALITLADGSGIELVDTAAFAARYGSDAFDGKVVSRFAAMTFGVRDPDATRAALTAGSVPFTENGNAILVAPIDGGGVSYRFVPAS
ncbi:VOC family protein [Amorphus coralli]|uniref:VOC family protein n=1 Tax=Amorphus coralli TaxID=340680 RepID=UPI00036B72D1|nr:VOC family protein [Amorphus coralli]